MTDDTTEAATVVTPASADSDTSEATGMPPTSDPGPALADQVSFSPHEMSNGDLEPEEAPETPDPAAKARREAARYRTELRAAESERDTLRGRLETLQRAQVEELASSGALLGFFTLSDGRDLWLAGVQLSDLLDDEGQVDRERVAETVKRVTSERPHWRTPTP